MAKRFPRLLFVQTPAPEMLEHRLGQDYVFLSPLVIDERNRDEDFDHQATMEIDHSLDKLAARAADRFGMEPSAFLGAGHIQVFAVFERLAKFAHQGFQILAV